MARYCGPVCRLCRRAAEKLFLKGERCFTPRCAIERRRQPPGGERTPRRRRRVSDRAIQLREKQKARQIYGVLERQFRRYFAEALRRPGITGQYLLQLLETRLDNVIYRLGFADSRNQARQLVLHGHFTLNGRKANIPSIRVKLGDVIAWKESSTKKEVYQILTADVSKRTMPHWLTLDTATMTGQVLSLPAPEEIDTKIDSRLIVGYYSR